MRVPVKNASRKRRKTKVMDNNHEESVKYIRSVMFNWPKDMVNDFRQLSQELKDLRKWYDNDQVVVAAMSIFLSEMYSDSK